MIPEWLQVTNDVFLFLTNFIIVYIGLAILVFTVGYYVLFDPRATTAGKFIWRFSLSLVGFVVLVFIGVFIDPDNVLWWRPLIRLIVYGYVAFTITGLAVVLILRKWKPTAIKTALDRDSVKPRHETNDIPILKQGVKYD